MHGELLFFNRENGHGFIRTEEGERLYVERGSFLPGEAPEGRCAGTPVRFVRRAVTGEHGFAAFDVERVLAPNVGRARRRTGRRIGSSS